jgi:transposase-like protein
MNKVKHAVCVTIGCTGNALHKIVSWIHPMTGVPIWREYCEAHVPVSCPRCRFSVGISSRGIDKKRKIRKYRCESCRENFSLELF